MNEDISIKVKIMLEKTTLPFDISGAIVFGSRVKGKATPYSGLDLLNHGRKSWKR